MTGHLTSESVFPNTMKWVRVGDNGDGQTVYETDGYRVEKGRSHAFGSGYKLFTMPTGESLGMKSTLQEAKTAAEMHSLGFGSHPSFYNVPQRARRARK